MAVIVGRINRLLLRLGPWPVRVEEQVLYPSTLDRIAVLLLYRLRLADQLELALWKRLLKPGMRVLDVGANLGLYALVAADRVGPSGHVGAFEADPVNAGLLAQAVKAKGCDNITVVASAVADRVGTVHLRVREEHRGAIRIDPDGNKPGNVAVPATTLDEALGDSTSVDLIKYDIEGAELLALRGMTRVLADSPDLKVITEFWPKGLRGFGHDPREFLEIWERNGFQFFLIDEKVKELVPMSAAELLVRAEEDESVNIFLERAS